MQVKLIKPEAAAAKIFGGGIIQLQGQQCNFPQFGTPLHAVCCFVPSRSVLLEDAFMTQVSASETEQH